MTSGDDIYRVPQSNPIEIDEILEEDPWLARVARWDDTEADEHVRSGISLELITHLQSLLDLTDAETADLIGRSRSTYTRYRDAGRSLQPVEAERAVRAARILALAVATFGTIEKAGTWMREENYALGEKTPLEMAETDFGARAVRDLLRGLEHGHAV
jgi:putative toxin-antitoxin system antitoxin component (TIGR02293 family)